MQNRESANVSEPCIKKKRNRKVCRWVLLFEDGGNSPLRRTVVGVQSNSVTSSVKQTSACQSTTLPKSENVLLKHETEAVELRNELLAKAASQFVFCSLCTPPALVTLSHHH
jgi:hypothetical protein